MGFFQCKQVTYFKFILKEALYNSKAALSDKNDETLLQVVDILFDLMFQLVYLPYFYDNIAIQLLEHDI